ncbi:MAG: tyrosine-type recombinase/integrase [Chloroflexi bacterium]|nr:tyrosine-type recombinase/integrase [Chloroflexota bacterium]
MGEQDLPWYLGLGVGLVARALVKLGVFPASALPPSAVSTARSDGRGLLDLKAPGNVPTAWGQWCERWYATSTLTPKVRRIIGYYLLRAGRWLATNHPDVTAPDQWTRELAAAYVAAVDRMVVGEDTQAPTLPSSTQRGAPLGAATKDRHLAALRVFFRDGQEWNWFARRFDPRRTFATPPSIKSLLGPKPRVIADDIWAKLLWAGLNLTVDDLPALYRGKSAPYPLPLVRALVIAWLFTGLRWNELRRLRVGCIRWQREDVTIAGTTDILPQDAVCWLDVPVNKTSTSFTKAVDRVVGEAIAVWERARPTQLPAIDPKTHETVQFLFAYRGRQLGEGYLNTRLIPLLCRKAGVPTRDARGNITSHRARSTIASQLANAKEPMSLLELMEWLGHRDPEATLHYVKVAPTRLAKAYADAGYFARNLRAIEVLIDQGVVESGAAAKGEPWRFYDLGHGYCTYKFFDQCPHRMACAKCSFYRPKGSSQAQLLEGKANLLRYRQEIPLTEDERAAVDDGVAALEQLLARLADIPTPDGGPAPRQRGPRLLPMLPPSELLRSDSDQT